MKKCIINLFLIIVFGPLCLAQKSIDLSMTYPPGSGISHNFSIYEPVGFNSSATNKLIIGFHPFNIGVWNANSWRDTLRSFVDLTGALLVCPDGGANGRVDDAVDLEFTEVLIDSISAWYKIDADKIFLIGFSVGGKAVYDYALSHPQQIKGSIPIGAAIEGTNYSNLFINGRCRPFYLVHGNQDSPNSRYYPMKTGLELKGALVDGILMANVGHTINFNQRNTILNTAFNFVDTSECDFTDIETKAEKADFAKAFPSILTIGQPLIIEGLESKELKVSVWNSMGQRVHYEETIGSEGIQLQTTNWSTGITLIHVISQEKSFVIRVLVLE